MLFLGTKIHGFSQAVKRSGVLRQRFAMFEQGPVMLVNIFWHASFCFFNRFTEVFAKN